MSPSTRGDTSTRRTVVEEGTRFKGDLSSTCPIDVRGRVEGNVEAPSLTVSAAGSVHGKAKVGSVRSEGELSGEFEAETIELSGTVKDQTVIRARSLEVKLSSSKGHQVVFGDCELSVGDEPTEFDAVEEPVEDQEQDSVSVSAPPRSIIDQPAPTSASSVPPDSEASASESPAPDSDEEGDEAPPSSISEALASKADEAPDDDRPANGGDVSSGWSQPPSQPPPAE